MKVRAVILDVYKTLLEVLPPPADASRRWTRLWKSTWNKKPDASLKEFSQRCQRVIEREHSRARGVLNPEIFWPAVAAEALPRLAKLSAPDRDEFLYRHAQLVRTARLMPGAEALFDIAAHGILLGIASNAQPYTLRELDDALGSIGPLLDCFHPWICFWSFENGFSKPNPHAFQLLSTRLQSLGIDAGETLMVGDRMDNDIEPAQRAGWQTWLFTGTKRGNGKNSGNWQQLSRHLLRARTKQ